MKNKLVSMQLQPKDIVNKMKISIEEWKILWTNYWSGGYGNIHLNTAIGKISDKEEESLCNLVSMLVGVYTEAKENENIAEATRATRYFTALINKLSSEKSEKKDMYANFIKEKFINFSFISLASFLCACQNEVDKEGANLIRAEWDSIKEALFPDLDEERRKLLDSYFFSGGESTETPN